MTTPHQQDPTADAVDAQLLRSIFRRHAAGVAVITAGGAIPVGFTATSLASVAVDPPLVSFNVSHGSSSWPAISAAEYVGVHLLAADQEHIARTFATSNIDRFATVRNWRRGPYGLPVLNGVLAFLAVRVHTRVDAGGQAIVIAHVQQAEHTDAQPLLYHDGQYRFVG
jgi:flavin reductase (DIM6/NTAB) family NADH-FMN oxidoreductase RutF